MVREPVNDTLSAGNGNDDRNLDGASTTYTILAMITWESLCPPRSNSPSVASPRKSALVRTRGRRQRGEDEG